MLLTEIAVQNVAGFPPTARVPLKAGLNAFVARDTDLMRLVRAVLYPGADDGARLCTGSKPRKAAVTIVGRDGHTYRVVRDFDGGRSLLTSDPATRQPVKVADDEQGVAEALRTHVGLPPADAFRHLLLLAEDDLPGRAASKKREATLPPTATAIEFQVGPDEARRKLPALAKELEKALQFEAAQDAQFQLANRLAELSAGTSHLDALQKEIDELDEKLRPFARVKELTAGIEAKLKRFPEAQARREGAQSELQKKRAEYEQQLTAAPTLQALMQDRMFTGGAGGGLLCIVLAVALGVRELWWLDLVGFGVAAFAAWKWVAEVEHADHGGRRLLDLNELEKRIQKQYEAETQPVIQALRALGANSTDEVLARLEERDVLEARRLALVRDYEAARQDPKVAAADTAKRALEAELREREAFVNAFGFSRDPAAIRREIAICEEVLGGRSADADPLAGPIERAAAATRLAPPALLDSFRDRLAQYLAALTDRRFVGVKAISPGVYHVVASTGASGPVAGLSSIDRELIYVALRVALAERVGAPLKFPVFVDEPSVLVDAPHRALFVKMLKSIAAMTQVVVRAYDAPPAGVVDHVARATGPGEKAA